MSTDPDDPGHEEEGIRAFRDLSESMDRMGHVLTRVEGAQRSLLSDQQQAASRAVQAAGDAQKAAEAALAAARHRTWPVAAWAVCGALAGILGGTGGGYFLGRSSGWDAGYTAGYAAARDEQAAMHWANSPGGRTARALEAAGSLTQLAACSAPGWQVTTQDRRRVCTPSAIRGAIYGWYLP